MRSKASLVRGFTLLELMVVLVLISIMLGWSVSSYVESSRRNRFRSDVVQLQSALKEARDKAIREGVQVSLCLFEENNPSVGGTCTTLTKLPPTVITPSIPYDTFSGGRNYSSWQNAGGIGLRASILQGVNEIRSFDLSFDEILFPPAMNDTPELVVFGPDGRIVGVHPWLYDVPPIVDATNTRSPMAIHLYRKDAGCHAFLLADRSGLFSSASHNQLIDINNGSFDVQRGAAQIC